MSGSFGMTPDLRCEGELSLLEIVKVNVTMQDKQRKARPVAAIRKGIYVLCPRL